MNVNYLVVICCFFLVFSNCKHVNETDSKNNYPTIYLELKDDFVFWMPDSLFEDKRVIPLETTAESLIGEIKKVEIVNDTLYVWDNTQDVIFIFEKTGKYIAKIDNQGRGANEYIEISDFHIDNNIIYVVASSNRKIMCYNTQGEFLNAFSTKFPPSKIAMDSNYIYIYHNFSHNKNYNVTTYHKNSYAEYKHYKYYLPQQAGLGYNRNAWISCGNKVYASFPYEYNIYQLLPDTCHIVAAFDCGIQNMFPKDWKSFSPKQQKEFIKAKGGPIDLPVASDIQDLFVTPSMIWFSFIYKSIRHVVIINRQTGKIIFGIPRPTKYYWNIMNSPVCVSNDYIVISSNSSSVLQNLAKASPEALEHRLGIKEEDNPCLYFYKFKD